MQKIHFVGIGGIGVSALARYYLSEGWSVTGSDIAESEITKNLEKEGVKIHIGHDEANLNEDTNHVVYSVAVEEKNLELQKARKLNLKTSTYAEALAELTKNHFTIAVAGSHGKGTTTSLLALMMIEAGLDPTVIIGTKLKEFGGKNFRKGTGKYLLIEADEYNYSFLNYSPSITIVTNTDKEHLDVFKNIDGVITAFNTYLKNLSSDATVIVNAEDQYSEIITESVKAKVIHFNMPNGKETWDLQVPGDFNQLNTEAAWQAAKILGIKRSIAEAAAYKYEGAWRRMEEMSPIRDYDNAVIYSDYAHHPTEIRVTIKAMKDKYPGKRLLVIFQPHQVRRLTASFSDFVSCFEEASELVLLPVYEVAGREVKTGKTSEDLKEAIEKYNESESIRQKVYGLQTFDEALKLIEEQVVIFMGAGSIDGEVRKHFRSKLLPG